MTSPKAQTPATQHSIFVMIAASLLGLMLVAALLVDDLPLRVILLFAALAGLQGLWRGISETAGVVVGFALSAMLALPLGRLLEPLYRAVGVGGLAGRLLAFATVTFVLIAVCGWAGRKAGKSLIQRVPALASWDRVIGAGLGGVYGVLLGTFLLFIPLALEPVAIAQGASSQTDARPAVDDSRPPNPTAALVVSTADKIRSSPLGATIAAISPVKDLTILNIAADFAAVSRDPVALDHLLATPVFRDLAKHPTITSALERFRADPELRGLIEREKGVSAASLAALVTSPTITELLDNSTIIDDLRPRTDEMVAAIRAARAKVAAPPVKP
jgi:uncharacterized membrane protein required for colicin V production